MEEYEIKNFEKAPYLELENYKAPAGIKSIYIEMDDGIKIRVCIGSVKRKIILEQFFFNKVTMNLLKNILKQLMNFKREDMQLLHLTGVDRECLDEW